MTIIFKRRGNSFLIYTIFDLSCHVEEEKKTNVTSDSFFLLLLFSQFNRDFPIWISSTLDFRVFPLSHAHTHLFGRQYSLVYVVNSILFVYLLLFFFFQIKLEVFNVEKFRLKKQKDQNLLLSSLTLSRNMVNYDQRWELIPSGCVNRTCDAKEKCIQSVFQYTYLFFVRSRLISSASHCWIERINTSGKILLNPRLRKSCLSERDNNESICGQDCFRENFSRFHNDQICLL